MRELSHAILDVLTMYVNLCTICWVSSLSCEDKWRSRPLPRSVVVSCTHPSFTDFYSAGWPEGCGLTGERVHHNCYNCLGPFLHLINGLDFGELILTPSPQQSLDFQG